MLAVRLICVGKLGEKFWAEAVREYEKRLGAYCKLEIIELPEQRLPQTPSDGEIAQALDKEAALIEAKIPQGAAVVALCVEGKEMSSEQLADYRPADCRRYQPRVPGYRWVVRPVGQGKKTCGAAAFHVADDVPAPPRTRHGARAAISRAQHRRGR